jgi:hypothetical protein
MFSLNRKLLYRHYVVITSSYGSSTNPSTSFIAMSSEQEDYYFVNSVAAGTFTLVELDWDDGSAANLLQGCSSLTRRRLDSGVDRDDDDSDEVLDCIVDTMLNMVHLEGTAAGALCEGQNERAGGEQRNGQQSNVVSASTEDASIKKRRGPKKIAMWTDDDGSKRPCLSRQSFWYSSQYVLHPDLGDPHSTRFFVCASGSRTSSLLNYINKWSQNLCLLGGMLEM